MKVIRVMKVINVSLLKTFSVEIYGKKELSLVVSIFKLNKAYREELLPKK